jgi:pectinesterase
MNSAINSAGWSVWNDDTVTTNIYYGEYANTGDGASGTRVSWSKKLTAAVTMSTVWPNGYSGTGWYDGAY